MLYDTVAFVRCQRHCEVMKATLARCLVTLFSLTCLGAHADQVQMQNGDRYMGKVVSLSSDTLVLQNDMLGTLKLPRSKVSTVTFGALPTNATNVVRVVPRTNIAHSALVSSNAAPDLAAALRQLGTNNPAEQDHTKLLEAAGPEAKNKFNELLSGLMTGKLSMADLRAQAKAVADQARALRGDLGEDGAASLDGYLAILDKFLNETAPKTNTRAATPNRP